LREDRVNRPAPGQSRSARLFHAQAAAALANALTTTAPFCERLVWFWTNHFTVSRRRPAVTPLAAAFVEEAIRPHVTGHFAYMLLAVMRHPAMLLYLDNVASIGPDGPAGARTRRGLNENLARECLELHTVSPASGYSQADVTAFARVLTGWSTDLRGDPPGFRFRPAAHEPGEQIVMRQRFSEFDEGGVAACASSPITARPTGSWPASRSAISSLMCRRPARCIGSKVCCATRTATSLRPRQRWFRSRLPGARYQSCARRRTS
jgi:uncharacterized protein (DUF1800 family)